LPGFIEISHRDTTGILAFNRPDKRNALSSILLDELSDAIRSCATDGRTRAIVITGNDKLFSSGADMSEVVKLTTVDELKRHKVHFREATSVIEGSPLPVIAAINGFCMTGGLELALACDFRIADHSAVFAVTSSKIGSMAGAGGTQRLPRVVGAANAIELLMLGNRFSADQAMSFGLLHRLVPTGTALEASLELAAELAERPALSLALAKRAVREGMQMPLQDALDFEASLSYQIFPTHDRIEGMRAFLEKRPPQFTNS
jgi:enoyl-CoA hydratase/carnithine racemase